MNEEIESSARSEAPKPASATLAAVSALFSALAALILSVARGIPDEAAFTASVVALGANGWVLWATRRPTKPPGAGGVTMAVLLPVALVLLVGASTIGGCAHTYTVPAAAKVRVELHPDSPCAVRAWADDVEAVTFHYPGACPVHVAASCELVGAGDARALVCSEGADDER